MEKNELPWTDGEIIAHYRQAANPYVIIGILADLNDVSRECIRAILRRGGINPPTKRTRKKYPYKANHYTLISPDGTRYTVSQMARMTGYGYTTIWTHAREKDVVEVDGVAYRVERILKGSLKDG